MQRIKRSRRGKPAGATGAVFSDTADDRLLLSNRDVARLMGISESHLHALKQSGRFGPGPIRLGRTVRYSRNELIAWLRHKAPSRHRWETLKQTVE